MESTLLVALTAALIPLAASQSYSVAVCPDAQWHDLVFLKGPSSPDVVANITDWSQAEIETYAKDTIIPQVTANFAFLIMAFIALIVFLMWRIIRRCCMCCCMAQSCASRRAAADPHEVVSGWRFWLLKGAVLLVAVTAFCMMLAGIGSAEKELVVKVWAPVDRLTTYLHNMTDTMDSLVLGLDGVDPILNNLTAISNVDINFPSIRANLQSISAFLDAPAANPNTVDAALVAVDGSLASARGQLLALKASLQAQQPNVTLFAAGMSPLSTAVATFNDYSTKLTTLSTQFGILTSTASPPYNTVPLESAMSAANLSAWQPNVDAMLASLDVWTAVKAFNSLGALATAATTLDTLVTDLKNNKVPATTSAINNFLNAWTTYSPAFTNLLNRVDSVQANVVQLDNATNASINRLRSIFNDISGLLAQNPTPSKLSSDLATLTGELTLGSIGSLVSNLNNLQTAINNVPNSALDGASTAVGNVKAALDALAPKKDATAASLAIFKADNSNAAKLTDLQNTVSGAGNSAALTTTAQSSAASAASSVNVLAVQTAIVSGGLVSLTDTLKTNLATQLTTLDTATNSLNTRVPASLSAYTGMTGSVKNIYNGLPSPKSAELNAVTRTVSDVEKQMVKTPDTVRAQVDDVQRSFGDGVDKLRDTVINKIEEFQDDNTDNFKSYDGSRYTATVVLYAVAVFLLVVLIITVAINCPWGVAASIVLLLIMTILLFLLSIIMALGLVVLQDACYHTEEIALSSVGSGSSVQPLMAYYLRGNESTNVKEVLKQAKLVDVDQVTGQVTDQANAILSNITSTYTPRPKLQVVLDGITGFINLTLARVDSVISLADFVQVQPIYIAVKSFPCCDVTDYAAKAWVILTFGGWLILITCNLAMGFLSRLDQLPHSGCCGCKPLLLRRIDAQVHPDGGDGSGKGYDGQDEEKGAVKAVVLSAPGYQAMGGAAVGAGGMMVAADTVPMLDPNTGMPYGAYPPAAIAMDPYTGAPVDAYTGAPVDPYTGMAVAPQPYGTMEQQQPYGAMEAAPPPPPPVAPPPAAQ